MYRLTTNQKTLRPVGVLDYGVLSPVLGTGFEEWSTTPGGLQLLGKVE